PHLAWSFRTMTAVMRRFVCLFAVILGIAAPGLAAADLQELGAAAYEYRNRLYGVAAAEGPYEEVRAELDALIAGEDHAAAEALAESMVPAGYDNYQLW